MDLKHYIYFLIRYFTVVLLSLKFKCLHKEIRILKCCDKKKWRKKCDLDTFEVSQTKMKWRFVSILSDRNCTYVYWKRTSTSYKMNSQSKQIYCSQLEWTKGKANKRFVVLRCGSFWILLYEIDEYFRYFWKIGIYDISRSTVICF